MLTAIVTPIHARLGDNRLDLLEQTVRSVVRQPDELIHLIIDDDSPAPVRDVVAGYRSDQRLYYLRRTRRADDIVTASYAQNLGLNLVLDGGATQLPESLCRSVQYLTSLHSDDLMVNLSERVRACSSQDVGAAFGDLIKFDGHHYAKRQKVDDIVPDALITAGKVGRINFHSLLWQRGFAEHMRRVNIELAGVDGLFVPFRYAEDRAVAKLTVLVASRLKLQIAYVRSPATLYRVHSESLTQTIDNAQLECDRTVVDQLYYPHDRPRAESNSLVRSIYLAAYRPFKPLMRRVSSRLNRSPWLDFVNDQLSELGEKKVSDKVF